jgi:hypothetical protein
MKKSIILLCSFFLFNFLIGCNTADERGFNKKSKIHSETKSKFDKMGFDFEGYNVDGFNKEGFDKGGYAKNGYDKEGFNRNGWSQSGINKETRTRYNKNGFDINNFDIKGHPNLTSLKDKKSDDVSKTWYEIYNLLVIRKDEFLVKNQFETTVEFEKRKNLAKEERYKLIDEYFKKVFVWNYFDSKYNADEEVWEFNINELNHIINKDLGTYNASNAFGKTVAVKEQEQEFFKLVFVKDGTQKPYSKTIKVPMKKEEAKINSDMFVQLIYKINDFKPNNPIERIIEMYYYNNHEPTLFQPWKLTVTKRKILVKYLGLAIWNKDKNKLIYSEFAD